MMSVASRSIYINLSDWCVIISTTINSSTPLVGKVNYSVEHLCNQDCQKSTEAWQFFLCILPISIHNKETQIFS